MDGGLNGRAPLLMFPVNVGIVIDSNALENSGNDYNVWRESVEEGMMTTTTMMMDQEEQEEKELQFDYTRSEWYRNRQLIAPKKEQESYNLMLRMIETGMGSADFYLKKENRGGSDGGLFYLEQELSCLTLSSDKGSVLAMVSELQTYPFPVLVAQNNAQLRTMFANVQVHILRRHPQLMVQMLEMRRHQAQTVMKEYAPQMKQYMDESAVKEYGAFFGLLETMWPADEPGIARSIEMLKVPFRRVVSDVTWFQSQQLLCIMANLEIDVFEDYRKTCSSVYKDVFDDNYDNNDDDETRMRRDALHGLLRISTVLKDIEENWKLLPVITQDVEYMLKEGGGSFKSSLIFPSPMQIAGVSCVLEEHVTQLPICDCCENLLDTHSILASTLIVDDDEDLLMFVSGFHPLISQRAVTNREAMDQVHELVAANQQLKFFFCKNSANCSATFNKELRKCKCMQSFTFIVNESLTAQAHSKTANGVRRMQELLYKF